MLNKYQKLTFELIKLEYFYLHEYPLFWDENYTLLRYKSTLKELIPFLINGFVALLIGGASLYDLVSSYCIQRTSYNMGVASLHLICALMIFGQYGVLFCAYRNPECIQSLNTALRKQTEIPNNWRIQKMRMVDLFGIFGCAIPATALLIYTSSLILAFDPFFIVLGDIFPNPTSLEYFSCCLIRGTLTLVVFEVSRHLWFCSVLFVIIVDVLKQLCHTICSQIHRRTSVKQCCTEYKHLALIYAYFRPIADSVLSLVYSFAFWVLVAFGWVIINGYGVVPSYLYWVSVFVLPLIFWFLVLMLHFISAIAEECTYIVTKLQYVSSLEYATCSLVVDRRAKHSIKKGCQSLKPFAATYKPTMQSMDYTFTKDWMKNIVERLFDAILLFES